MSKSRSIARIVGPSLVVMVASELKIWNPTLYESQIVPLVYLSGVLMFIAGISIVHRHNIWIWGWQSVITMLGWFALWLGALRMFYPQLYNSSFENDNSALIIESLLIFIGMFLTYKAYLSPHKGQL